MLALEAHGEWQGTRTTESFICSTKATKSFLLLSALMQRLLRSDMEHFWETL